jgi:glycosyltransferase involved in cell wall biosynthesis
MPDGSPWPRVSIVTPSFNQGQFLEETIRSVLLQGYPNLEYLVIDGGSTDDSTRTIQRYEPWLTYWVSEKDRGQANAINKGFALCSGELAGWINSDDLLLPGALANLGIAFQRSLDTILLGDVINFLDRGKWTKYIPQRDVTFENLFLGWRVPVWHQPGTYVSISLIKQVGILDETLRYAFDWDWMFRLVRIASVVYLHKPIAKFRLHENAKTTAQVPAAMSEIMTVLQRYWDYVDLDKKWIQANYEIAYARHCLNIRYLDRRKALAHLLSGLRLFPRLALSVTCFYLLLRSVLPFQILQKAQKLRDGKSLS